MVLAIDDPMTVGVDEANVMSADLSYTGTGSLGDLVGGRRRRRDAQRRRDRFRRCRRDGHLGRTRRRRRHRGRRRPATATGTDGDHLVERFLAGGYTVVVDTADLPAGMVSVSEPDAVRDSRTSTTLAAGQDRTDADFGYRLQADLSIDSRTRAASRWTATGCTRWRSATRVRRRRRRHAGPTCCRRASVS
ncbi:MAG: hypothetical protein R2713_13010 [Ilumatobacteraceae bacterium]